MKHKMAQKPIFYSGFECQTRSSMDRFKAQAQGLSSEAVNVLTNGLHSEDEKISISAAVLKDCRPV